MDVSVSVCKGFTALVSTDYSGRELQGYVKVTMSLCHSWAPSCRTLLIYTCDFSIQLVLLLPRQRWSRIPKRSLTINSEVADAALWDWVCSNIMVSCKYTDTNTHCLKIQLAYLMNQINYNIKIMWFWWWVMLTNTVKGKYCPAVPLIKAPFINYVWLLFA